MRSFIAVELDPGIIARLAAVQQALRAADAGVAWVRPEGIHLTLKFLGEVEEARMPVIGEALARAVGGHAPFEVAVVGAGGFPSLRSPRVVWAGITVGAQELAALAAAVEDAMAALGFSRENRPFQPHLTLGRVKSPAGVRRLVSLVEERADEPLGQMRVGEVSLMRSDLSPAGARYTALQRIPLRGVQSAQRSAVSQVGACNASPAERRSLVTDYRPPDN